MLDHYVWGAVSRISPEAPVPVVHVKTESMLPGGAANVYHNLISLEGQAELCGVIGQDESGRDLLHALGRKSPRISGILVDRTRPTTRKTRILAHSQQVVRYDIEQSHQISAILTKKILRHVESRLSSISCLIISDYAKGVITAPLMTGLERLMNNRRIPILVDPKVVNMPCYSGVTLITPNHLEAQQATGQLGNDDQAIHAIGHQLRQRLRCETVLITRGEGGMTLCEGHRCKSSYSCGRSSGIRCDRCRRYRHGNTRPGPECRSIIPGSRGPGKLCCRGRSRVGWHGCHYPHSTP